MAIRVFHASKQQPQIIATEFTWNATYIGTIAPGIQEWGMVIAGARFWFAYLVHLFVLVWVTAVLVSHKPDRRNPVFVLLLLSVGGMIFYLAKQSAGLAYGIGLLASLVVGIMASQRTWTRSAKLRVAMVFA